MATNQYRCVVNSLAIRTQPQLGDQFKTQQQIKWNEVITVDENSRTEAAGYVWLKHDRGWSAERSLDNKTTFLLDASLKPKDRMWGINIDPYNAAGNPPAAKLAGTGWVRFVFHVASKRQTIDQAFAYYDPIIKALSQTGINVLLVIIHDTYAGNIPWQSGDWNSYIPGYADTLGKIASHYRGQVSAYEIWNEGDLPPAQQSVPTSVYVPPQFYGPLLLKAAQAVRQADPGAKVISGGLVSGTSIQYMTKVRDSLNGVLPVDGIAIHPYGQTLPDATVFPNWSQGSLLNAINAMVDAFPGFPIWITEYGVPRVDVNNTALWPPIASYMAKTFQLIHSSLFHVVPVVIWFGWTDSMDNAGIVKDSQQPKGVQYETFFQNVRLDSPAYIHTTNTPYDGKILLGHVAGQFVSEQSVGELAQHVNSLARNVGGLLVKTSAGPLWEGAADSKKSMAISSPADLQKWIQELARYKLGFHAWHDLSGQAVAAETALIAQIALTPGINSVVLDLDVSRLILRTSNDIRAFMIGLRKALPTTYHLGLSFDGRPESFASVNLLEWYPFINSWHPKVFHWQFSNGHQGPDAYLKAAYDALKPYPKPVIPMLQAEPLNNTPVPPDQIKLAARLALGSYHAPAVSFWRLGAIGPTEFSAIQSIAVPYTAGYVPAPTTPDTLKVSGTTPLRIRATPSVTADVAGTLQPGEQISVLDRTVIAPYLWVRHSKGWTAARNLDTNEVFLA